MITFEIVESLITTIESQFMCILKLAVYKESKRKLVRTMPIFNIQLLIRIVLYKNIYNEMVLVHNFISEQILLIINIKLHQYTNNVASKFSSPLLNRSCLSTVVSIRFWKFHMDFIEIYLTVLEL